MNSNITDRQMVTQRLLDAPRELVFEAFTNPEHVKHWWGPNGFTNTIQEMDVRPGGIWRLVMHGPDGRDYPNKIVFIEVVRPELLVYRHSGDELAVEQVNFHVRVTFEAVGQRTNFTMTAIFETAEELQRVIREYGADQGAVQTVTRLQHYLNRMQEEENQQEQFEITRVVNAPRELVYKLWSEQEHLAKWWGPAGMQLDVKKLDFTPGGLFHYSMKAPDGSTMWGRFEFVEMIAPERIVFVSAFSDENGGLVKAFFSEHWPLEIRNVLTLEENEGKTTIRLKGGPINASDAEQTMFKGMFGSMQQGFSGTFDQLDKYIESLKN